MSERLGPDPIIFVFWHNQLLLIPVVWNRFLNPGNRPRGVALTSPSKDGELVAQFLERFGIGAVRGSATRRGAASLRELARFLQRGHDVGLTPDSSRGPVYEVKPGLILLAQLSGCTFSRLPQDLHARHPRRLTDMPLGWFAPLVAQLA